MKCECLTCGEILYAIAPKVLEKLAFFANDVDVNGGWWFPANRFSFYENKLGSARMTRIEEPKGPKCKPASDYKHWDESSRAS